MNGRATDKRYASAKRLEALEQTVENMQAAIDSQTAVITDLRARLLPQPVDIMFQTEVKRRLSHGSPVVRSGRNVEV